MLRRYFGDPRRNSSASAKPLDLMTCSVGSGDPSRFLYREADRVICAESLDMKASQRRTSAPWLFPALPSIVRHDRRHCHSDSFACCVALSSRHELTDVCSLMGSKMTADCTFVVDS